MVKLRCFPAWVVVLGVVLVAARPGRAVDSEEERATLKGMDGVAVLVDFSGGEPGEKLTQAQVHDEVEAQIKKAGVRVRTLQEYKTDPVVAGLHITLTFHKIKDRDLFAYLIRVEVVQPVSLKRDPKSAVIAATWWTDGAGTVGTDAVGSVHATVAEYVEDFVKANAAVNKTK